MQLKVQKIHKDAILPVKSYAGDAGWDLFSVEDAEIAPQEIFLVKTGIVLALPPQTEAQIRPRSGLALKHGITVLNSPGTIDTGYHGEIGVILVNHSKKPFRVTKNMRIAQMVIQPVLQVDMLEVADIGIVDTKTPAENNRGVLGFGSSGV
ncbi:MAG: dUTP diphosphatase [Defluviitaleaceae bacterium]|nr:dUTP diphosphatase [Defluviitaleaceae bacterium]